MFAAVYVFIDHPVIGVGPGMFKTYAEEYGNRGAALRRIEGDRRAHSLLLEIAAESGALGLTIFLAMLLLTLSGLASARRSLLERDPETANLATAYLLALVGYVASGVFLHLAYMRYFYLVLALGGAACTIAGRAFAEEAAEPDGMPTAVPDWSTSPALRPGESA
jgi:O-antigen ligase